MSMWNASTVVGQQLEILKVLDSIGFVVSGYRFCLMCVEDSSFHLLHSFDASHMCDHTSTHLNSCILVCVLLSCKCSRCRGCP